MSTRLFKHTDTDKNQFLAGSTIYEIPLEREPSCCQRNGKFICYMIMSCSLGVCVGILGNIAYLSSVSSNNTNITI